MNQDLHFNILTFSWPKKRVTFYFSKEKIGFSQKIYKNKFPKNIEQLFPGIVTNNTDFIYTSFIYPKDGYSPLEIDFKNENKDLIKHYYNWRIGKYFSETKNEIVNTTFIEDRQIWLRDLIYKNESFVAYNKFTLKIQFEEVSSFPELIVSYDGQTKIIKTPISQLVEVVSPTLFKGMLYQKKYFQFHKLQDEETDFSKSYAVLNSDLRNALGYGFDVPDKSNKYIKYKNLIDNFTQQFLSQSDFNEIIPINSKEFISVEPKRIGSVNDTCNDLVFKDGVGRVPKFDFKKLKPLKSTPHKSIHLFFILHESYTKEATKLQHYLKIEHSWYRGLYNYTGILYHVEKGFSIVFKDLENPMPEIKEGIKNLNLKSDITYVAIYLSPFGKHEPNRIKREVYYQVKEELLKKRIVSQVIDYSKLKEKIEDFVYELTNISLALLAKLQGTPWQLDVSNKKELVIGVGAFKNVTENIQYIASAFCFQNTGKFSGFEYFTKSDTKLLSGAICDAIHKFTALENNPDKVVIHFYKEMSDKEMQPIINKMKLLDLGCPLFIININKTKSLDLIAYDTNWNGNLMPKSGTFINISNTSHKYLLFNNNRYADDNKYPAIEGYPFPIKLAISSPTPEALEDFTNIKKLIEQVYQFSRLYWKSLRQQNVPITIKYPEMVAEIAPHFSGGEIPPHGKEILWFL